jgi:hypothetical protein
MEFSKEVYNTVFETIAAAIKSFENNEDFNEYLAMIYEFLAKGNINPGPDESNADATDADSYDEMDIDLAN